MVLFDDTHFSSILLKAKGMRTVQVFFEDCVASS